MGHTRVWHWWRQYRQRGYAIPFNRPMAASLLTSKELTSVTMRTRLSKCDVIWSGHCEQMHCKASAAAVASWLCCRLNNKNCRIGSIQQSHVRFLFNWPSFPKLLAAVWLKLWVFLQFQLNYQSQFSVSSFFPVVVNSSKFHPLTEWTCFCYR